MGVSLLAWRECIVPVIAFSLRATFTEPMSAVADQDLNAAFVRLGRIEPWIDAAGGIEKALMTYPILASWRDGRLHVEDGSHRLGSAVFWYHQTTVRVLCADLTAPTPSLPATQFSEDQANFLDVRVVIDQRSCPREQLVVTSLQPFVGNRDLEVIDGPVQSVDYSRHR